MASDGSSPSRPASARTAAGRCAPTTGPAGARATGPALRRDPGGQDPAGRLPVVLAVLMAAQAALGLAVPAVYRDVGWIRAGWAGNDAVTLLVAVPLLVVAVAGVRRGSGRAALLRTGLLGYAAYNYAFYLLGATLNAMFPVYVALVVLSVAGLVVVLAGGEGADVAGDPGGRVAGGVLVAVGAGLAVVWLAQWAGHVLAARPVPGGPEAFRLVAALDLTVMLPALLVGGTLLWRRHPRGRQVGVLAAVQASLYLLVLAVNSAVAVVAGTVAAPGEVPLWVALLVLTGGVTVVLLGGGAGVPASAAPGAGGR